mgnify:CR=1 FL=1
MPLEGQVVFMHFPCDSMHSNCMTVPVLGMHCPGGYPALYCTVGVRCRVCASLALSDIVESITLSAKPLQGGRQRVGCLALQLFPRRSGQS